MAHWVSMWFRCSNQHAFLQFTLSFLLWGDAASSEWSKGAIYTNHVYAAMTIAIAYYHRLKRSVNCINHTTKIQNLMRELGLLVHKWSKPAIFSPLLDTYFNLFILSSSSYNTKANSRRRSLMFQFLRLILPYISRQPPRGEAGSTSPRNLLTVGSSIVWSRSLEAASIWIRFCQILVAFSWLW